MEKKVIKTHKKGQKHLGKTDWAKVTSQTNAPIIDEENPELAYKKPFHKPEKS